MGQLKHLSSILCSLCAPPHLHSNLPLPVLIGNISRTWTQMYLSWSVFRTISAFWYFPCLPSSLIFWFSSADGTQQTLRDPNACWFWGHRNIRWWRGGLGSFLHCPYPDITSFWFSWSPFLTQLQRREGRTVTFPQEVCSIEKATL